jgi:hypothetical protein
LSVRRRSYGFAMTIGFAIFGAFFLVGLALGTYTRRPFLAACFLTGCFAALVAGVATDRPLPAAATFGLITLAGDVFSARRTLTSVAPAGVAELADAAGLGPAGP